MIKSILVATDGSPYGDTAVDYGLHLAGKMKARMAGLHVLDSRVLEGPLMADLSGWLGASPFADQLSQFRSLLESKGEAIGANIAAKAEAAGMPVECMVQMGHPARTILETEAMAEMLVLGRHGEHADYAGDAPGSVVEAVMRRTTKPVLVTPASFKAIGKVLVGFDGSSLSSRALHEGIELAQALGAPLVVLAVAEHHDLESAREYTQMAMRLVRAHEAVAAPLIAEGRAGPMLLEKAEELGCDLIVTGAFGHTRMREMVIGSTTTYLMVCSNKPVLFVR
jgi:nucleotide-binding universal stress UspA family protein